MHDQRDTRPYEAPRLRSEGTVRDLTFGQSDGDFTDAVFPVNTPKSALTFS
jgi:hypothetical protein